jgi:hypothetical protein
MKKILLLVLLIAVGAQANQATLVTCNYSADYNGYEGIYRSFSGNLYRAYFRNWCPFSIDLRMF